MSLVEVSEKAGLDKSTTHRMLQVLVDEGYVYQDPSTHRYQLHTGVLQLASAVLEGLRLPARSRSALTGLRDEIGESVGLHVRSGNYRLCAEEIESRSPLRMASGVGNLYPLCAGAAGKVLVAYLDVGERVRVLRVPEALGPWVGATDKLEAELSVIRERGWAVSEEETTKSARAVSAPIWDFRGRVAAAINVAGPTVRLTSERLEEIVAAVRQAAAELSRDMGWTGPDRDEVAP
jgi:DNA-binding IclR family transcriptional regulator